MPADIPAAVDFDARHALATNTDEKLLMKFSRIKKWIKAAYLKRRYRLEVSGDAFELGKYCVIRRNDHARILLGKGFCARNFVSINVSGLLEVGENVFVNAYSSFNVREHLTIGDGTLIGEGVRFYDHDHDFRDSLNPVARSGFKSAPIHIGRNVWLGANAVVLRGVCVGDGAVVAAGTVVSRDVPANHLYLSKDRIEPIVRSASLNKQSQE